MKTQSAEPQISPKFSANFESEAWNIHGVKIYRTVDFDQFINRIRLKTDDILAGLAKTYSLVQQIGWINPNPMSIILEATDSGAKKLLAQTGQTEGHAFHQSFSTVTYQGVDFNGIVCLYPREIDKVGKRLKGILPISIHTLTTLTHEFSHAFGTTVPGASVISSDERSAVELLTDSISYQANAGTNMHKNLFYAFNYLFEEAKSKGIDFTNSAYDTLSKSVIAKNKK